MNFKYKFCIWLVDTLLLNEQGLTIDEIQHKWRISSYNPDGGLLTERSFHRYRNETESLFNIDIVCEKNNGGVYKIASTEELDKNTAIQWLLNGLRISNLGELCQKHQNLILEDAPLGVQRIQIIMDSIEQNKSLRLTYKSHYKLPKEYFFVPVFIRLFKQRWYVIGADVEQNRRTTFALERILDASIIEKQHKLSKELKQTLNPDTYFAHCYGIIRQYDPITIRFRAFFPQNLYLKDVPIHESQESINETEDYTDFEIFVRPTYDLKQEFLWNRDKLAVLAPESFRLDMIQVLEAMLNGYKTGESFAIDE
ncbi:WYL domain-containing protein [Dysgonomonas mossii]|uniref:WYL domain-containing protein n=2 Tax=Dysgonomonas TaxID=156973 RepID=UPI00208E229C|nr:WYL domain-containing protein [Dysgonomonas mossii]